MLQGEHSAILLTFIKLPFAIKAIVLSIFKRQLYTGFTVYCISKEASTQDKQFLCFHNSRIQDKDLASKINLTLSLMNIIARFHPLCILYK